ncbi:1-aminocyclopropane-1-carboxylate deaminase/D-cysteine desulfhydrase [Flavobacterium sp. CYK-55]|uniref:1-aminocyclopropane-1-carboxylate deaminase/D-cysteine desulfhydrase n=1 Tax=Flavobacterium sp. CYK-55 TaxID=2835529 RepID=UPI00293D470A|nr:pyridoxal-phosphate dependent enzyme [Flavobacterium sp. CYK-55]
MSDNQISVSYNQILTLDASPNITLAIKREDLLHKHISGNKFRKLKYNLEQAKFLEHHALLTFGGAYSNHIAAVAAAGKEYGFKTIGVIRGDELASSIDQNPTLAFAQSCGMQFDFVSRDDYKHKESSAFVSYLQQKWGAFYLIPEGGTNTLAVQGAQEILINQDASYDYICCAVGTGGTISGLIHSAFSHQKILGFPALKGDFLTAEICKFAPTGNWELISGYEFGGYAKVTAELIKFMNDFYQKTQVQLDPIYTAKMVFGVTDLISKGYFENDAKILMIHTGGLQGIQGMNQVLKQKKLPLIVTND